MPCFQAFAPNMVYDRWYQLFVVQELVYAIRQPNQIADDQEHFSLDLLVLKVWQDGVEHFKEVRQGNWVEEWGFKSLR